MKDPQTGIAIRFIRHWTPLPTGASMFDQAFMLALHDERDVEFGDKLIDAMTFLKSRVVH